MVFYLLSKEDFAALYKYGEVNVKTGGAAESEDPFIAVKQLFDSSDYFEYAQERLIVSCSHGTASSVKMMDVQDIYPLDGISKNLFESQFNRSIIFKEPVFQDLAEDFLRKSVMSKTTISGVNGLRSIFGFDKELDDSLVKDIIRGKSFLQKYRKYFDVPFEERTPFSMLIAYNRYQHYPKDNRGYFYDAADCFIYGYMYASLQDKGYVLRGYDREIVAELCSSFFSLLDSIPANALFTQIIQKLDKEKPKIIDAIAEVYGSIRLLALYFYAKDKILADETLSFNGTSLLYSIGKKYPEDFQKLLTLLGGFFGYTWIYDRIYEFSGAPFLSVHRSLKDFEARQTEAKPQSSKSAVFVVSPDYGPKAESSVDVAQQPIIADSSAHGDDKQLPDDSLSEVDAAQISVGASLPSHQGEDPISTMTAPLPEKSLSDSNQDPISSLELDIPGIVKAVFKKSCPRRELFTKRLEENREIVTKFALDKDELGLKGFYMKLDQDFNPKKDLKKQEAFVKACLELKQSLFK